jgi:diguanylate cyclase (GGDEF)-like protein
LRRPSVVRPQHAVTRLTQRVDLRQIARRSGLRLHTGAREADKARMKSWFSSALLGLVLVPVLVLGAGVARAAEPAQAVLDAFRLHGYPSPLLALEQLRAATPPAADAPLPLRRRYQSALAAFALRQHEQAVADAALAALTRMAEREGCADCRTELLLRALQRANLSDDGVQIKAALAPVDRLAAPADAALRFDWLLARAEGHDELGEYDSAIELSLKAAELAQRDELPVGHVLTYNMLLRSNAGRRDLQRAVALARDGYQEAQQIGFTFGMVLLRANEAYARASLNLPHDAERRAALYDTLRLARSTRGLQAVELTTLINLSNYHNDQHEYVQGERWGAQAEALALRRHDGESHAFAMVDHGVALVYLGQVDAGLERVRAGVAYTEQHALKLETADLLAQLVDAADQAGRPREALQALRKLMTLREQLTRSERDKAVLQMQEQYAAERKTREIERLQLENARRAAELTAHTTQQRLWAASAIALTLATLMLAQWLVSARRRALRLEADNVKLSEQSSHDPLTGAFNRRHCERLMGQMAQITGQCDSAVGLMVVDVDFFKKVNDTHGHASGDAVLVEVARRLQGLLRDRDAVVRWGGEEFVLVLPGTRAEALSVVAERVLSAIGGTPFTLPDGSALTVQISGGAVAWPAFADQHWEDALHLADLALYLSKASGRNRMTCLTAIDAKADLDRVRRDLRVAGEAGEVTLQTVAGPVAPLTLVPAAA